MEICSSCPEDLSHTKHLSLELEINLYRLKGHPIRAMESSRVAENREKVALKFEQLRGSQPLGSGGKEKPSKSIKKDSWYDMSIQDAQE
jgi:hypothetical protein